MDKEVKLPEVKNVKFQKQLTVKRKFRRESQARDRMLASDPKGILMRVGFLKKENKFKLDIYADGGRIEINESFYGLYQIAEKIKKTLYLWNCGERTVSNESLKKGEKENGD